jgi:hypothetical protein
MRAGLDGALEHALVDLLPVDRFAELEQRAETAAVFAGFDDRLTAFCARRS